MLARQRQDHILAAVRSRGGVHVAELTEVLGVSDMTIRRDIDALARQGFVERVHGGAAAPAELTANEPGFEANSHRETGRKQAVARAAAECVSPGMAIAIGAGTTTWTLAHELRHTNDLTVVTNSPSVAQLYWTMPPPHADVMLVGGVRTPSDALVGPLAQAAIAALHVDVLFIGAHGIDLERGLTTPNLMEADTNRAFINSARSVVAVVDSSKWGMVALSSFAQVPQIDTIVTDDGLPTEVASRLDQLVRRVIVAETVARSAETA